MADVTSGTVSVEQREHVLLATIANPPHQLLDRAILAALLDLTKRADQDPGVTGVVLTGAHAERFVAHFDVRLINSVAKATPQMSPETIQTALKAVGTALRAPAGDKILGATPAANLVSVERGFREVTLAIEACPAVWVAALNGDCGGGGTELALACDLRYMADGYRLTQPEVFLGFPPGAGGTQRQARLIGRSNALKVCLDGGPMAALEAKEIGLVDEVHPPEALLEAAMAEAERLGRRPKQAIGAIKRSINIGGSLPLVDGLRLEAAEFLSAITTPESLAAQEAYVRRMEELGELPIAVQEDVDRALELGRFA